MNYIDKLAPTHERTSCDDESPTNARYALNDFGGCSRCTLLAAREQGIHETLAFAKTILSAATYKKLHSKIDQMPACDAES